MTDGMLLREFLSEPDLASYRSAQVPQLPWEGEPPTLASLRSAALLTLGTFLYHILSSLAFLSFPFHSVFSLPTASLAIVFSSDLSTGS